jgi:prophage antirepressor-like protein
MSEVAIFENSDFGSIRVADKNGEPWFVVKDACDILGIRTDTIRGILEEDEVDTMNPNTIGVPSGGRDMLIVSESGLYSLIFKSRKPEAKAFSKWVRSEVLPSIRKTGSYSVKIEKQNGLSPVATDFKALCEAASFLFDKNQAALCANTAIKKVYGEDLLALMGVPMLESPQQVRFYTPTELGKEIGKSAVAFNKVLLAKGLQVKTGDKWEATEAGKPYSRMFDTGKRSGGAPVQQMKWSHEVLGVIG